MDFQPASQNGITPVSEYKTLASDFGLAVSNTATVRGTQVIIKALSNAAMYKTEPVTFYSDYTAPGSTQSSTIVLGTATFATTAVAPFVTYDLSTGTHSLWAMWPGEGKYAGVSSQAVPVPLEIIAGYPLNADFTLTASPTSGTLVVGEGDAIFRAIVSTSTQLTGNIIFYDGQVQIGSVPVVNNSATLVISTLGAGSRTITALWPPATINGVPYEGISTSTAYTIASGNPLSNNLILSANPTYGVTYEGNVQLTASITSSTNLGGTVTFYRDGTELQSVALINNTATITIPNNYPVGTYAFTSNWDGNQNGAPKYDPRSSNTVNWNVVARDTIPSVTLSITPNPSVYDFDITYFKLTANTDKTVVGDVNFYDGTNFIGTAPFSNNRATLAINALGTGTHAITAYYTGNDVEPKWYPILSSSTSYTVVGGFEYPGTITLTSSANPVNQLNNLNYTLTASSGINGPVILYENTYTTTYSTVTNYAPTAVISDFGVKSYTIANISNPPTISRAYFTGGSWPTNAAYWIEVNDARRFSVGQSIKIGFSVLVQGGVYEYSNYQIQAISGTGPYYLTLSEATSGTSFHSSFTSIIGNSNNDGPYGFSYFINTSTGYRAVVNGYSNKYTGFDQFSSTSTYTTIVATTTTNQTQLASATISGTNVTFTVNPNNFISTSTSHDIQAVWAGGRGQNNTPYYGKSSNVINQVVSPASLTLTTPNSVNLALQPITLKAATNAVSPNTATVVFKEGSTVLGTVNAVGSTATLTVSAGSFTVGNHSVVAYWNNTNPAVQSNTLTFGVINPGTSTTTLSLSTDTMSLYNEDDTPKTITAVATVVGQASGHPPAGTVTLSDAAIGILDTVTLVPNGSVSSTATFVWAPATKGQGVGVRTLKADYLDDAFNLPSSSSNKSLTLTKLIPNISLSSNKTTALAGEPIAFIVTKSPSQILAQSMTFQDSLGNALAFAAFSGNTATSNLILPTGTTLVSANYPGDQAYDPKTVGSISATINKIPSITQQTNGVYLPYPGAPTNTGGITINGNVNYTGTYNGTLIRPSGTIRVWAAVNFLGTGSGSYLGETTTAAQRWTFTANESVWPGSKRGPAPTTVGTNGSDRTKNFPIINLGDITITNGIITPTTILYSNIRDKINALNVKKYNTTQVVNIDSFTAYVYIQYLGDSQWATGYDVQLNQTWSPPTGSSYPGNSININFY